MWQEVYKRMNDFVNEILKKEAKITTINPSQFTKIYTNTNSLTNMVKNLNRVCLLEIIILFLEFTIVVLNIFIPKVWGFLLRIGINNWKIKSEINIIIIIVKLYVT